MLKNFRSYHLAVRFYQTTRGLRAPDGLRDQLGRAASSVAVLDRINHEGPARQELDLLCRHLFGLCRALRTR